jgi:Ca2+-binding EF-hand superfamily protein
MQSSHLRFIERASLRALAPLLLAVAAMAQDGLHTSATAAVYTKRLEIHGVPILATDAVAEDYLYIAALVYDHMTGRDEPYDLRALHRKSGFRILLIEPHESFLDLPEYAGSEDDLDQAGGLGGCIGEFHIALRTGSPHTLVHELGHGIYHSAIQFEETGGADDEEAWYRERVETVHGLDLDDIEDEVGEGEIHEVLLAPNGTFSADLAAAWRNADANELWADEYAGTEPNEYWAEGVALWFRAWRPTAADPREYLRERDPLLAELCARVFPDADWAPSDATVSSPRAVPFHDDEDEGAITARGLPIDLGDLLDHLDRDRDGHIDAYEGAEALLFLVAEADEDGDNALEHWELIEFLEADRDEEWADRVETFRDLDQDGDERLVAEELPEELRGIHSVVDHDGDGSVTLDELLATDVLDDPGVMFEQELLDFLEEVDEDGDGAFALADLPLFERAEFAEEFAELDTNGDALVDRGELLMILEEELRGATFEVRGRDAVMTGVIGPSTPGRVLELITEHPEVRRIVMPEVPGSLDDDSNIRAARYVRRAGLATHVPANGEVASGGTDFFQAGVERTAGSGARFGVHSWDGIGEEGRELPRDDPEHDRYIDYYREMGIPEEFYWFTLEAAPADDIHWMTAEELERYSMLTDQAGEEEHRPQSDQLGGCVLTEPLGEIPEDPARVTAVVPTTEYGPLPKKLEACGIVLAAEARVPDEFLVQVGRTIAEIFRDADGVDIELQRAVLGHLHSYRALLPVPRNERSLERLIDRKPEDFDRVARENSLCDIIMAQVPEGQVMEVVEHILHAVSDVGLHYQFPKEWGLSNESDLWKTMQLAIERGHYVIESYDDMRRDAPKEVYERVLLQEFAYWFISTAWDLQEPYGPNEREWSVRNRSELRELYPDFFATYERTAERVMRAPTRGTLAELGPTRAEERRR